VEVFRELPGVIDLAADHEHLRLRVVGPIAPIVQAAARFELIDFVSREPSLEEIFLAEYGHQVVGADDRGS
jgi:ABC-2 type transport system ATP-binding protein